MVLPAVEEPVLEHHQPRDHVDAGGVRLRDQLIHLDRGADGAHLMRQRDGRIVGEIAAVVLQVDHERVEAVVPEKLQEFRQPRRGAAGAQVDAVALRRPRPRVKLRVAPRLRRGRRRGALRRFRFRQRPDGGRRRRHWYARRPRRARRPALPRARHRNPGAGLGEPPAGPAGVGLQGPRRAAPHEAQVGGGRGRHRVALPAAGVRPFGGGAPVRMVVHAAVEAGQHRDRVRGAGVVAERRGLFEVARVLDQRPARRGEVVPGRAAVGGLVETVERGAEQQGVGLMRRRRHAGEVGDAAHRFADRYRLPRRAAILAQVQAARGGGRHPQWIARIDAEGGDVAVLRRLRERVHHPVREAGAARLPGAPSVQGQEHPGAAAAGIAVFAGRHHLLETGGNLARRVARRQRRGRAARQEQRPRPPPPPAAGCGRPAAGAPRVARPPGGGPC